MRSTRTLLLFVLCSGACAPDEPRGGIETRVSLDRTAALVGDPLGVTIEVETPPGYTLELPAAPAADEAFASESIQMLDPIQLRRGVRHHLLWTLRPRALGEHALPTLELPLVQPDGSVQLLPVGGMPFRVRSVREEVPEQEVFFDIRPAPEPAPLLPRVGMALLLSALAAGGALIYRRQHRQQAVPEIDLAELARHTRAKLEDAFEEPDARRLADRLIAVLWAFIEQCFEIKTASCTATELPQEVSPALRLSLRALENARFEKTPAREAVLKAGRAARATLSDVAN